jgi:two-component system response regulator DevR
MRGSVRCDARLDSLSVREKQIMSLIADGLTNREIGLRLSLAEKTVKNYVSGLLSKLGLQRRTQAAVLHLETRAHGPV